MTDITLEQRARDIVVQSLISHGYERGAAERMVAGGHLAFEGEDVFAMIKAALRLSAGADWALVPRVPTEAMCKAAGDGPIFIEGRMDGNTFIQSTHYDQRYLLDTWERMIAAAPRHETGEG